MFPYVFFAAMLMDVFKDNSADVKVRFRLEGNFFNLKRLQARPKIQIETLCELLFADDCTIRE